MNTLVIITGPQGSGNHLFSKILALHPEVHGWKSLIDVEWEGHDKSPFNDIWNDPKKVNAYDWGHKYMVASISCPYYNQGNETIPDYANVIRRLKDKDLDVKLVIIGRDQNILEHQEERVRGKLTYPTFLQQLPKLMQFNPIFVSTELLYLYRRDYLVSLQNLLKIPIATEDEVIDKILLDDANEKYIIPAGDFYRDALARDASHTWKLLNKTNK